MNPKTPNESKKVQLAIIGLGQIGTSIGLCLGAQPDLVYRTGYDTQKAITRKASQMGAIDAAAKELKFAVRTADFVILALPFDQIRPTLTAIAAELKDGAVVMDTAPQKEIVTSWADELLPEGRYHVGLVPVLNPSYLHEPGLGIDAARSDLFQDGMIWIVSSLDTPSAAIKLASDLAHFLGARHRFADPLEVDGLMAQTYLLPQLIAAGLLDNTVDRPGWWEAGLLAGRAYAEVTHPILFSDQEALSSAILANSQNMLRSLDGLIESLQDLRSDIEVDDQDALRQRLECARQGRIQWWQTRLNPAERLGDVEIPSSADFWKQLFGSRNRKPDR